MPPDRIRPQQCRRDGVAELALMERDLPQALYGMCGGDHDLIGKKLDKLGEQSLVHSVFRIDTGQVSNDVCRNPLKDVVLALQQSSEEVEFGLQSAGTSATD